MLKKLFYLYHLKISYGGVVNNFLEFVNKTEWEVFYFTWLSSDQKSYFAQHSSGYMIYAYAQPITVRVKTSVRIQDFIIFKNFPIHFKEEEYVETFSWESSYS